MHSTIESSPKKVMEPVARRTRSKVEEQLFKSYVELKEKQGGSCKKDWGSANVGTNSVVSEDEVEELSFSESEKSDSESSGRKIGKPRKKRRTSGKSDSESSGMKIGKPQKKRRNSEDVVEIFSESDRNSEDVVEIFSESDRNSEDVVEILSSGSDEGENWKDVNVQKMHSMKRIRTVGETDLLNILANSIIEDEPVFEEDPTALPLKFTFGVEESAPVEKSEEELEDLWRLMGSALCAEASHLEEEEEIDISPETETQVPADLCKQGKHYLVINEEIGIYCRYCPLVQLEMKYYTVPFAKRHFQYSERRDYREQTDVFDELHNQDSNNDQTSCDPFTCMEGTVWDIIPGVGKDLHAHQRKGFEFLWKKIAGGIHLHRLKQSNSSGGKGGCIISHAPGTGKTRLAIVFLQTYMKLYPNCRPVIVAPCSMLLSWEAEFRKWNVDIPFHNLNQSKYSRKENAGAMEVAKSAQHNKNISRLVKLLSWNRETSVLGLSYKLFEELVGEDKKRSKEQQKCVKVLRPFLLGRPGLLVLDEGHTARNERSLIYKALSKVKTEKRVILTGTPFQNNFDELYNLLYFVRPKFIDPDTKDNRGQKMKGAKGVWFNMTRSIGKDKKGNIGKDNKAAERYALAKVRKIMEPFVDVHRGNILQERLPGLRDAVVMLNPGSLQKRLLEEVQPEGSYFDKEHWVSLVSVHPSLMCDTAFNMVDTCLRRKLEKGKLDPDIGAKTKFLMQLIRVSGAMEEKVLVFSQYLDPLMLIGKQLKNCFRWSEGTEYLHMHGKVDAHKRQALIKNFNDRKSRAKVMLASIKACSEGINLVGASRVVLLDVVWNPSVKRQAISRAYRLGQNRVVHVYHLLTSGTLEEEKYCRQAEKDRLSELVFTSRESTHMPEDKKGGILEDTILEQMVEQNKLKEMFKKIVYQSEDSTLIDSFD